MSYLSQALNFRCQSKGEVSNINFEAMFNQALEEINSRYESGTIPYAQGNYPALWQEIIETETRLNDSWLAREAENFKKALEEWERVNLRAIKTFRERGNQESLPFGG